MTLFMPHGLVKALLQWLSGQRATHRAQPPTLPGAPMTQVESPGGPTLPAWDEVIQLQTK